MNADRLRILKMLADGKVSAEEAERLLDALAAAPAPVAAATPSAPPRYFRVLVDAADQDGPTKVNVRVPMQLLRAGVKLSALIPPAARDEVNAAMARQGLPFDINQLKPENLDDLVASLDDLTVDVDTDDARVRVFCE
ncbi:hypothetical protein [uncultured Caulobacter sp.]|uniref:SHOCT-like domain-containing protein n=1 Tax=uncultured Caulobacter sp. TaxID=158749 RepID=UPI002631BC48|nr:hypothetical protein [uncultured Caulobacter sp.]